MTHHDTITEKAELADHSSGRLARAARFVRDNGVGELFRLIGRHGVSGSARFVTRNVQHVIADRLARRWDRVHGVDTAGSIRLELLDVIGPNRSKGNECVCTSPKTFDFIMSNVHADLSDHTFIDIGSGKSRTLLLASHYPFAEIVGVEFAGELVRIAERNIAAYADPRQKCMKLSVIEADAAAYAFPDTPLFVYFYNPFSKDVFDMVMGNLAASLRAKPRDCIVVYGSSSHDAIRWAEPAIMDSGMFEKLPTPPMPHFLDAVRTIDYAIFRHEPAL